MYEEDETRPRATTQAYIRVVLPPVARGILDDLSRQHHEMSGWVAA